MSELVYNFLFPFFAVMSAVFVGGAIYSRKILKQHEQHEVSERERHVEKTEHMNSIADGIDSLTTKFDDQVLPTVNNMYDAMNKLTHPLSARLLLESLEGAGFASVSTIEESPIFLAAGGEYEGRKLSFLFRESGNDLVFDCFSFKLSEETQALRDVMHDLNNEVVFGRVCLKAYPNCVVPFATHSIHMPSSTPSVEVVRDIIKGLIVFQDELFTRLSGESITGQELLFGEFIPMHNAYVAERSEQKELADKSANTEKLSEPESGAYSENAGQDSEV